MTHMDNPAGRLLHWFDEVAGAHPNKTQALRVAWAKMLSVDPETVSGRAAVFRHVSLLADQCVEVRSEIAALPEFVDAHLLAEHFDEVEEAVGSFTRMDQITLESQLQMLQTPGRHSLKMLDAALHRHRPQRTVGIDTVQSLLDDVRDLLMSLDEAMLDDDVRDFVRIRFTEVLEALRDSRVKGAKVVETITDAMLSNYHREPTMWKRTMESGLGTVIGGILLQLVLNFTGLAPSADALPPGTPPPVIEQTVHVYVEQSSSPDSTAPPGKARDDDEVVDAEIVED